MKHTFDLRPLRSTSSFGGPMTYVPFSISFFPQAILHRS